MSFDAFADFRMDGHTVIITGGAQNIGAGIARTLCGAGARVMIADLNGDMAAKPRPKSPARPAMTAAAWPATSPARRISTRW